MKSLNEQKKEEVITLIKRICNLSLDYGNNKNELDNIWYKEIESEEMLNKNNEESRIDYNFYEVFVSSLLRRLGIDREKFKNDIRTIYGEDSFKHFCYAIYCKVPYGG